MQSAAFIGAVSDTHGIYDPQLDVVLAGAAHIVHAGDVGDLRVLARLRDLAPVTVVAGNTDPPDSDGLMPWEAEVEVEGRRVLVGHILGDLLRAHDPAAEGFALVVSGHSHRAAIEWRGETLFLNPGSAGRPRFGLPRTCALVALGGARLEPRIVTLT